MVEQMKKALGGWSLGKEINIGSVVMLTSLAFTALWFAKDKVDKIDRNEIKLVSIETGYIAADDEIRTKTQTDFVAIDTTMTGFQREMNERALVLQKLVITQGYIVETLDDISERIGR